MKRILPLSKTSQTSTFPSNPTFEIIKLDDTIEMTYLECTLYNDTSLYTLVDSKLSRNFINYKKIELNYVINRNDGGVEEGRVYIYYDIDTGIPIISGSLSRSTGTVGVKFDVGLDGSNIQLLYTLSNRTEDAILRGEILYYLQ